MEWLPLTLDGRIIGTINPKKHRAHRPYLRDTTDTFLGARDVCKRHGLRKGTWKLRLMVTMPDGTERSVADACRADAPRPRPPPPPPNAGPRVAAPPPPRVVATPNARPTGQNCAVCWEELTDYTTNKLECCTHVYCGECLRGLLTHCLDNSELPTCKSCTPAVTLTPCDVETAISVTVTLPGSSDAVDKLQRRYEAVCRHVALTRAGAQKVECLTCGFVVTLDPGQDLPPEYRCRECGHKPQLSTVAATAADQKYLERATVPCSGCKAPIEKSGGCNKLHCTRCRAYTCWACGAKLPKDRPYSHFVGNLYSLSSCPNYKKRK